MTRPQVHLAWVAFFAVVGGSALATLAGLLAKDTAPALLAVAWVIGAFLGSLWTWSGDPRARELTFTSDGWTIVGWMVAFLFPPLGVVLGLVLWARGSSQGIPMVVASVGISAAYFVLARLV